MNASTLPGALFAFSAATLLTFPLASRAQSNSAPQSNANYTVSVQELRMAGKGQKAFDKGSALLVKGDAAGSVPYLNRAIAEYPGHYKAYYDLGVAQFRLGHVAEAQQAFQKSIDLTGGHFALPQFGMGMLLCQQGEFQQAETVIQRGLDVEPGSANGKYFLGWAQYGLNHLVEAERSLQQALLRNAKLADAYALLARIHQRQSNSAANAKDLEEYLKLNPHGPQSEQARHLLESAQKRQLEETALSIPTPKIPTPKQ